MALLDRSYDDHFSLVLCCFRHGFAAWRSWIGSQLSRRSTAMVDGVYLGAGTCIIADADQAHRTFHRGCFPYLEIG